jgi:hypothetical protein
MFEDCWQAALKVWGELSAEAREELEQNDLELIDLYNELVLKFH